MPDRPIGRKKNVTGGGTGVHKRGEGLGTGPVGSSSGYSGSSGSPSGGGGNVSRGPGRSPLLFIIVAAIILLGGGGGLSSLLGGGSLFDDSQAYTSETYTDDSGSGSQTGSTGLTGKSVVAISPALLSTIPADFRYFCLCNWV